MMMMMMRMMMRIGWGEELGTHLSNLQSLSEPM